MNRSAFPHRNLPRLLLQARESVMTHFRPNLRKYGLTDQQWRVLRVLGEQSESEKIDTGQIAQAAYLSAPSLSGVLVRMERDGLIKRQACKQDGRRTLVSATSKGMSLVDKLATSIESHYKSLESHLGENKLEQLYALLDEVIHMEATGEQASTGGDA